VLYDGNITRNTKNSGLIIMETNVLSKKENPLFARTEITAEVKFQGKTPSRKEIMGGIADKIGTKPELIAIRKIEQIFGSKELKITAHIYKTKEEMEKTEPKYIFSRNAGKKGKEAEAKAEPAEKAPEKKEKAEKASEKAAEKPAEKPTEKHAEKPAEKK